MRKARAALFSILSLSLCMGALHAESSEEDDQHPGFESSEQYEQAPDYYSAEHQQRLQEKFKAADRSQIRTRTIGPYGKTLKVAAYEQQNDYYCGPASAQIVIKYVTGKKYSQDTIASYMHTDTGGSLVWRVADTLKHYTGLGYEYTLVKQRSLANSVPTDINANYPVIYNVSTQALDDNYIFDSGHYIVGDGYYFNTGNYFYVDYYDVFYVHCVLGQHRITGTRMEDAIKKNNGYYIW